MNLWFPYLSIAILAGSARQEGAPSSRPQTPTRPLPYDERDVVIPATPHSEELAGTLTLPRGNHTVPAVILLQGGTPFDRDGTFAEHKPLFVLSDALTRAGFATLRLDDRGVGGSKGEKFSSTMEELSADLGECVRFLRGQERVRRDRIGLIGHSGGALTAALVASRDRELAFLVLLGCPARPLPELLAPQLAADGDGDVETNEALGMAAAELARSDPTAHDLVDLVRGRWNEMIKRMPESARAGAGRYVSSMSRKLPVLLGSEYLRDLFCFDPEPVFERISCPVLALWGEYDQGRKLSNTSPWHLARGLARGATASFQVVQVPRTNHFLQTCETGGLDEIARIRETIRPEVLGTIVEWLALRVE